MVTQIKSWDFVKEQNLQMENAKSNKIKVENIPRTNKYSESPTKWGNGDLVEPETEPQNGINVVPTTLSKYK